MTTSVRRTCAPFPLSSGEGGTSDPTPPADLPALTDARREATILRAEADHPATTLDPRRARATHLAATYAQRQAALLARAQTAGGRR